MADAVMTTASDAAAAISSTAVARAAEAAALTHFDRFKVELHKLGSARSFVEVQVLVVAWCQCITIFHSGLHILRNW